MTFLTNRNKLLSLLLLLALAMAPGPGQAEAETPGRAYTEGRPLTAPPADAATLAVPVSPRRAVRVENEGTVCVRFFVEDDPEPVACYIVPGERAHVRIELGEEDNPFTVALRDMWGEPVYVTELLSGEAYVLDQELGGTHAGAVVPFNFGLLEDAVLQREDPGRLAYYLVPDEQALEAVAADLSGDGARQVRWEYAGEAPETPGGPQAYVVRVVDQEMTPVPGVYANFCTDTACHMARSDENGLITFEGAQESYHVQLLMAPEGWSFDPGFELRIGPEYSQWVLRLRRD